MLAYPKFPLTSDDRFETLADYLPSCELVEITANWPAVCRDPKDQQFLDPAQCGRADVLVSGDQDQLALTGQTALGIETPEAYRSGVLGNSG